MKRLCEETIARVYYKIKPLMSRKLQIQVRSIVARQKRRIYQSIWPIDPCAGKPPAGFSGWPNGKKFCVVMTHDVDTARGVERCEQLMALEQEMGFRSSFNFVASDYNLPPALRHKLVEGGFEVGVHGLEHNRKLYESRECFNKHAVGING